MKYLKQLLIILLISCIGELLNYLINLPIPGSIYGMIILFILLCLGVVKIHHIKEVSKFLIDIMPVLFIPYAVGIIEQFDYLKGSWIQIIIITIVSTIITMVVTGIVSQTIIKHMRGSDSNESDD
ncbi:MAG: CidA/LrgA family protein [Alphaproteobacteria bacterium]|nr:CidA/LrgA family protein [Alphaproteobacteria bacterium]